MPTDPNIDTTVSPPDAPKAGAARGSAPWSAAALEHLDPCLLPDDDALNHAMAELAPVELFYQPRTPASPAQWLPAPAQPRPAAHDIRIEESTPRPSTQELHLPVPPLRPTGLRDIAGSPLSHLGAAADLSTGLSDELLQPTQMQVSSPCSSLVLLRHVTPEFDSTHQIMRIPAPQAVPPDGVAAASIAVHGAEGLHTPVRDASVFQPEIARVDTPSLSLALDKAWLAHQPQPPAPCSNIPQSAPPLLARLPAVIPPVQHALNENDAAYQQALASEHAQIAALAAAELGELRCHAAVKPQYTPMMAQLRVSMRSVHQRQDHNAADADSDSDASAAQLVGTPLPGLHSGQGGGAIADL